MRNEGDLDAIRPEDDDDTVRRKILSRLDSFAREKMARTLQDPEAVELARRAATGHDPLSYALFLSQEFERPIAPEALIKAAEELRGRDTMSRLKLERMLENPKIADAFVKNALARAEVSIEDGASRDDDRARTTTEPTEDISGERPIQRAAASPPVPRHETLEGLGKLGASLKASANVTVEMATAASRAPPTPDDEVTHPGGRYADDPRAQQVVRVEPNGSAANAAAESPPPAAAWTAGAKPKLKVVTDRVNTVDPSPKTRTPGQLTERMPAAGLARDPDAAVLPTKGTSSRTWRSIAIALPLLAVLAYVAFLRTAEPRGEDRPIPAVSPSPSASVNPAAPSSAASAAVSAAPNSTAVESSPAPSGEASAPSVESSKPRGTGSAQARPPASQNSPPPTPHTATPSARPPGASTGSQLPALPF